VLFLYKRLTMDTSNAGIKKRLGRACIYLFCYLILNNITDHCRQQCVCNERGRDLSCQIKIEKTCVVSGNHFFVDVIITNVSRHKIDVKTIPVFFIDGMKYWCPVEIVQSGKALSANTYSHIILKKGVSFTARMDLTKSGWDSCFCSVWPSKDLHSIVPPGHHELHLDIEMVQERSHIRSNKIQFQFVNK